MTADEAPKTARNDLASSLKHALLNIITHSEQSPKPIPPELTMIDSDYLKAVFESTLDGTGMHNHIESSDFENASKALSLSADDSLESIEVLDSQYLIEIQYHHGDGFPSGKFTGLGLSLCIENFIPAWQEFEGNVLTAYVIDGYITGEEIAAALDSNVASVNYALSDLEQKGYIKLDSYLGSQSYEVFAATAQGKRAVRGEG